MQHMHLVAVSCCILACRGADEPTPVTKVSQPVGVAGQMASAQTPRDMPIVTLIPDDRSTNLGSTFVPEVSVDNGGRPIPAALRASLSAATRLVHWPEMVPVGHTESVTEPSGSETLFRLALVPTAPLSPGRWYAIVSRVSPSAQVLPRVAATKAVADGRLLARFRIDSSPTVRAVELCEKGEGNLTGRVFMSEPIDAELFSLMISADSGVCAKNPIKKAEFGPKPADTPYSFVYFGCTGATTPAKLRIGAKSIRTVGAHPVVGPDLPEMVLDGSVPLEPSGCRLVRAGE